MFRRLLSALPVTLVLAAIGLVSFSAVSYAAVEATGPDPSLLDLAKPVYEAFAGGHYAYMAALMVILLVALTKRYLGDRVAFLHSDTGGSLLALVASGATAMAAGLATPDAHVTLALLKSALLVGIGAAGGYAALKNLLVDPILRPLAAKYKWLAPVLSLVDWIFSKPDPVADAKKAGDAAVAAKPGEGVAAVVGKPEDLK